MANWKLIKMTLDTGYAGATHEEEFEMDVEGMTEKEIDKEINKELANYMLEMIDGSYEIEDMEED